MGVRWCSEAIDIAKYHCLGEACSVDMNTWSGSMGLAEVATSAKEVKSAGSMMILHGWCQYCCKVLCCSAYSK